LFEVVVDPSGPSSLFLGKGYGGDGKHVVGN
jgi:hypothetical protein